MVTSSIIPREEDQVGPCEQLSALLFFQPLKHNMIREISHGPTPLSPPCMNYEIAPRMSYTPKGHRLTIELDSKS
jgi:hypothetical protein